MFKNNKTWKLDRELLFIYFHSVILTEVYHNCSATLFQVERTPRLFIFFWVEFQLKYNRLTEEIWGESLKTQKKGDIDINQRMRTTSLMKERVSFKTPWRLTDVI